MRSAQPSLHRRAGGGRARCRRRGRRVGRSAFDLGAVRPQLRDLLDQRVTDIAAWRPAKPTMHVGLERQQRQDVVDITFHRRRPPRPPRPDRWRHVIDDRDRAVEPAHETRNPQRKGRAVDDDQRVGPPRQHGTNHPSHMAHNPRQPARNGGKPDDRKVVHRQQADEAGRGHFAAADAREPQRFAGALPQRAQQRGAKPVAGFFGSDQENLQFAGRWSERRGASTFIGRSHRH